LENSAGSVEFFVEFWLASVESWRAGNPVARGDFCKYAVFLEIFKVGLFFVEEISVLLQFSSICFLSVGRCLPDFEDFSAIREISSKIVSCCRFVFEENCSIAEISSTQKKLVEENCLLREISSTKISRSRIFLYIGKNPRRHWFEILFF
jgi:hypothetical protein